MRNSKQGAKWIRREKRLAIYIRDGLACAYCGFSLEDGAMLTLDHINPSSKGGSNDENNLVTCCHKCNSSRQDRPVAKFIRDVAGYVNRDAEVIAKHVRNCTRRKIDVAGAREIISRRGWFVGRSD